MKPKQDHGLFRRRRYGASDGHGAMAALRVKVARPCEDTLEACTTWGVTVIPL
jgi:hypothetical protein